MIRLLLAAPLRAAAFVIMLGSLLSAVTAVGLIWLIDKVVGWIDPVS